MGHIKTTIYTDDELPIETRLLYAAEESIALNGIMGTSLSKCAKRCGTTGTAYHAKFKHFVSPYTSAPGAVKPSAMAVVIQAILKRHMEEIQHHRIKLIKGFEDHYGVTLHRMGGGGTVDILHDVESPLSVNDLVTLMVVPCTFHIARQRPRSWFAQFQLMVHLNEPAVLGNYFSAPWGSSTRYTYHFLHQALQRLDDNRESTDWQIGRLLRLIPMSLAVLEQDIFSFHLPHESLHDAVERTITSIVTSVAPDETSDSRGIIEKWLPNPKALLSGREGVS